MQTEPLHPQIDRFVREATAEMSAAQAASIIGCGEASVRRLCENKEIAAHELGQARGRNNRRWTITKAALITYLVRSVPGDRTLILQAIAEMCPHWSRVAQRAATTSGSAPTHDEPQNVIRLKRTPDRFSEHPDLFRSA